MTKKDYILIADYISKNTVENQKYIKKTDFIIDLCKYFMKDNPLFDGERFQNACYKKYEEV